MFFFQLSEDSIQCPDPSGTMLSSIGKPGLSKSAEISNVLLANCNSKSMASGVVMDHPRKQGPIKYNRCWRLWSLWGLPWLVQCANGVLCWHLGQWRSRLDLSHYSEIPCKFLLWNAGEDSSACYPCPMVTGKLILLFLKLKFEYLKKKRSTFRTKGKMCCGARHHQE